MGMQQDSDQIDPYAAPVPAVGGQTSETLVRLIAVAALAINVLLSALSFPIPALGYSRPFCAVGLGILLGEVIWRSHRRGWLRPSAEALGCAAAGMLVALMFSLT